MMFSDLPRELESEILSRVSATSLMKLQTTCKRWYNLFKDHIFINKNLRNAPKTSVVVLKKDYRVHSVSINMNDPLIEFTGKLSSLKISKHVKIVDIFHCDGLLLCTTLDKRLIVWNPYTGQTRWMKPSNRKKKNYRYFLGYENNRHKILRYSYIYTSVNAFRRCSLVFEIYDFNSDSWRDLDDFKHNWYIHIDLLGVGVCLRGNTYWVAVDNIGDQLGLGILFLLKFDFKRERFERLSLPFDKNNDYCITRLLADKQEKLFVILVRFSIDLRTQSTEVWVTDVTKIDEAKDAKIQYLLVADLGRVKGMSPFPSFVSCFLVENEMVVYINQKERTIIYIVRNEDHSIHVRKQVYEEKIAQGPNYWQSVVNYVPSLVQIQEPEAKEKVGGRGKRGHGGRGGRGFTN